MQYQAIILAFRCPLASVCRGPPGQSHWNQPVGVSTTSLMLSQLETLAKTGYMEKILDAIKSTLDGDAKSRCKELGVHRFHEIRDEMVTLYFRP